MELVTRETSSSGETTNSPISSTAWLTASTLPDTASMLSSTSSLVARREIACCVCSMAVSARVTRPVRPVMACAFASAADWAALAALWAVSAAVWAASAAVWAAFAACWAASAVLCAPVAAD